MRRLRVLGAVGAIVVLGLAVAPYSASAGAEPGLRALCERVEGGTWDGASLQCVTGRFTPSNPAVARVCMAAGGQLVGFATLPPNPRFGWACTGVPG